MKTDPHRMALDTDRLPTVRANNGQNQIHAAEGHTFSNWSRANDKAYDMRCNVCRSAIFRVGQSRHSTFLMCVDCGTESLVHDG